jgi:hypothetical protein
MFLNYMFLFPISVCSTLRCIRKLRCEENILDMEFECDGEMLVVVQETSGACVYRTQDCEPIAQYVLQKRFVLYLLIVRT